MVIYISDKAGHYELVEIIMLIDNTRNTNPKMCPGTTPGIYSTDATLELRQYSFLNPCLNIMIKSGHTACTGF